MKRRPQGAPLLFLSEVSIVVLIDFIVILVTQGIFLIQIVNINNINMYLIHFHRKNNIKMRFPKSWVFSFKPTTFIHYPSQRGEINCVDISKDLTTQSEIYRRGNVENDWNSSVVRRWPSQAIICFPSFPMPEVPLSRCWPS